MANIKSQKKRNRQNEKRRLRNKGVRTELKTRVKNAREAVTGGEEGAHELVRIAQKRLDKAGAKGVIHKNAAARPHIPVDEAREPDLTATGAPAQRREPRDQHVHHRSLVEPARAPQVELGLREQTHRFAQPAAPEPLGRLERESSAARALHAECLPRRAPS